MQRQKTFRAYEAEEEQLAVFADVHVDDYWTPPEVDTNAMNSVLVRYLESVEPELLEKYKGYKHQYFGYIMDGKKYIYGNYFCDDFGQNWRQTFIVVMDGGDCFFQAIYDVDEVKIVELYINGEA